MSGHSKWAKIKRAKGANDAKRGAIFTKLARDITVAAQQGGGDPGMNFTLRLVIEKAKQANMPKANIEQAIKRGSGESESETIIKNTYEAITSYGVGILIDTTTDNSNRTYSEIKNIVERAGEKLGALGSVSWQFSQQGRVRLAVAKLKKSEKYGEPDTYTPADINELEEDLLNIEGVLDFESVSLEEYKDISGDENVSEQDSFLIVRTETSQLKFVAESLHKLGWQVLGTELIWHTNSRIVISDEHKEKLENLVAAIYEYDDVDEVWTNAEGY